MIKIADKPWQIINLRPATLLRKRLWHRCFPANFAKFIRAPFIIEQLWWLLLMFLQTSQYWSLFLIKLQVSFSRIPMVTSSDFSLHKYFFGAEHGIYCWLSHQFLKARVKPQKYPLKLFCKKGAFRKFANFPGRHLRWSLFLIELQTFRPSNFMEKRLQHRWFPVEFTKCLRTSNLKSANDCFSNLFFHQDCPFNNLFMV